ncbi:hypothetical protein B0G80_8365 [Paraburkholderia sp. BL6669N2]|nr:hypothetical protein B0G80_8365 [Paraburkholderia sp. BL6669N2]
MKKLPGPSALATLSAELEPLDSCHQIRPYDRFCWLKRARIASLKSGERISVAANRSTFRR